MSFFKPFRLVSFILCTAISLFTPIFANAGSGPVVLYKFDEGKGAIIRDVSGTGAPLDLKINTLENTRWLPGGGLSIDQPATIIASSSPGKIVDAIKKSNAITIEAWIQPAQKTQSGPARIATLSNGTKKRNFTLGQEDASYDVRLRSTGTNENGRPSVSSPDNTLNTQLTHVVYTRSSRGTAKIFINGVKKSRTTVSGDLGNWSNRFSFALANEISGGKPWLGRFYRFAVYKRALGSTEIASNFKAGAGIKPVPDGPLALYTFDEGTGAVVHDRSGVGTPMDLKIGDTSKTSWIANGGLSINKATLITGSGSRKIINAVKASNAITIEAWLKPASTTQAGPARIVTLSSDSQNRDFTLGQKKSAYNVRLRSTATDNNGKPSLSSPSGTLSTALTHVMYTRDRNGVATLYINGNKQSQTTIGGDFSNWDINHGFALGNELTGDRPWLGKLYLVAIYDRALSVTNVDENFALGAYRDYTTSTAPGIDTGSETGTSQPDASEPVDTTTSPTDSSTAGSDPQTGHVTLNWSIPATRSNGTPLPISEISGYTLYYGLSAGDYLNKIDINDAYTVSATMTDLPLGTYYFVVTAHDTNGLESSYSVTATKTVN